MEKVSEKETPRDTAKLRKTTVWFRQAGYIAVSINLAQRTGVYQNLTVDELRKAAETANGLVINHVCVCGGGTRGKYLTCQRPIRRQLFHLLEWYVENLQTHLSRNADNQNRLFPHLNPWDSDSLDLRIVEIEHTPYPKLFRGNRTRRHNVELSHDLQDSNELTNTNLRELAALRYHSEQVATRSYDARNKAERASRANKALMQAANLRYGLENSSDHSDVEIPPAPSTTSQKRKRYEDVYSNDEKEDTVASKRPETAGEESEASASQTQTTDAGHTQTAGQVGEVGGADAPTEPIFVVGSVESETGLVADENILPYVIELQRTEAGHRRSGKAWSLFERATLKMAMARGVKDGKGKQEKVRKFLEGSPGWDLKARTPLTFLAQLCKMRRAEK